MKLSGRSNECAVKIIDAFKNNDVPAALRPVFLSRHHFNDDVPMRKWSWGNQMIAALNGSSDARGFKAWNRAKRTVKKGERGFPILAPLTRKITRENKEGKEETFSVVYGYRHVVVFDVEQTSGATLEAPKAPVADFLESLPLLDVAKAWGIQVNATPGQSGKAHGKYGELRNGAKTIVLAVKNLSTWAHELIHAADDKKQKGLKGGQHLDQEVVAELGGAILLETLGLEREADRGGCWEYIDHYAKREKKDALSVCQSLLNRTCAAVELVLETAKKSASLPCQGA